MNIQEIKELLEKSFPECDIDLSGEGCKLTLKIIGEVFAGKRPVQRQQLVYAVLNDHIQSGAIHAITIIAKTKEE